MVTRIVFGDSAVNLLMSVPHTAAIESQDTGYCCDTGNYERRWRQEDAAYMLWHILLYRHQPEKFEIEFEVGPHENVDWKQPVLFYIHEGDAPEASTVTYSITPGR